MQNCFIQRPGLFLQLAKAQGYQVIQYSPPRQGRPVFSTKCRPSCLHPCNLTDTRCPSCQSDLTPYLDPNMEQFGRRVRIDLKHSKYIFLPVATNQWEVLPAHQPQISHLQFLKGFTSKAACPETRQLLRNLYLHGAMPQGRAISYWRQNMPSSSQSYCLVSQSGKVGLLYGQDRLSWLDLQLGQQQVLDIGFCHGILIVVLQDGDKVIAHVYQLDDDDDKPEKCSYSISLPHAQGSHFAISFVYEAVYIVETYKSGYRWIKIDNVISSSPEIEMEQEKLDIKPIYGVFCSSRQEGYTIFARLNLDNEFITVTFGQTKIEASNQSLQMSRCDSYLFTVGKQLLHFVQQTQEGCLKVIKIEPRINRITPLIRTQSEFTYKVCQIGPSATLLKAKPAIEGCILSLHFLRDGRIHLAAACLI